MIRALKAFVGFMLFAIVTGALAENARAASGEVVITHARMSTSGIPLWVTQRQNFFNKYGVKAPAPWNLEL
jgi:hypothetical protein